MIRPSDDSLIYFYHHSMDIHKPINGLAAIVEGAMKMDPFSSKLFMFCNTIRTIVKLVGWEDNRFILLMKRVEKTRFCWSVDLQLVYIELNAQQINRFSIAATKSFSRFIQHWEITLFCSFSSRKRL